MNTNRAALRPTTCPVLIGRASYLETLLHLIEQACDGEGQTVLIAGEAGIGKSRLVDEVMTYVRLSHLAKTSSAATPPLIVTGHCYEPDRSLPYAPIFDILRSFFNSTVPQDIGPLLKPIAPFLVHQLPELVSLLATELPDADSGIELEQRRLFPSLAAIFTHLSQSQPLLLVIEDVHWSDETSLEFLLYLARRLSSHRILLLLTYRSEEVDEVFTPFLTVLDRERLTTELILPALTNEQVEQMIHTIFQLPRSAHSDLFTPIYRLTEGNPFLLKKCLNLSLQQEKSFIAEGNGNVNYARMNQFRQHPLPHVSLSHAVYSVLCNSDWTI